MRRKMMFVLLVLYCLFLGGCGDETTDVTYTYEGRSYDEWVYINSVMASTDNQKVFSAKGFVIDCPISVSVSADLKEFIEIELSYDLGDTKIECVGAETNINKDQKVEFYYQIVYDIYIFTQTIYNDKNEIVDVNIKRIPKPSVKYGWKVFDDSNNLIIDTTSGIDNSNNIINDTTNGDDKNGYGSLEEILKEEVDYMEELIYESEERIFSKKELSELTSEQLRILRNGIYARCGWKFKDAKLAEYFSKYKWYNPRIKEADFTADMLNKYQTKNVKIIKELEKNK